MAWFDSIKQFSKRLRLRSQSDLVADEKRLAFLEASISRYERIFQGSHGYGFLDWDIANHCMNWNGGLWTYLGYSENDMARISDSHKFMEFIHEEDRAMVKRIIVDHLKGRGPGEITFRIRKKKGGHVWTEVRFDSVRDQNGWVSYISGIVFDVTKLKQTEQALLLSEARHARIIQASNDGIWEWSAGQGRFHFSNRCWEHLGYSDHDDVVNQGVDRVEAWRRRMHPEDGKYFDKILRDHIMQLAPFDVEYRIRGKDEHWRWIRARGQMTFDDAGKPLRMSGTNMDITELKLAEERVLKAKETAEKANQAKSEFLSNMSHELRTPLNAILGFAQLFDLDENLSSGQKENLEEIKKAGQHLLQLIGEVLDLAKIESGKMTFSMEQALPSRLIMECLALLKPSADARGIEINVDFSGHNSETVKADNVRLKQVLLNLISNAVKYNKHGGVVDIQFSVTSIGHLRIEVKDTGCGIPDNMQSELFQPFNRLGAEGSSVEGTGVGLVISKQLVERMGGLIGFSSKEKEGSRFWIEFPRYESLRDQAPVEAKHEPVFDDEVLPELSFSETRCVLYVEDNPSNQKLMSQLLARYSNIKLELAEEALRGLYFARTKKPDLIILDINLPGMDGFEILEILKQDSSTMSIPVVALSANAMAYDIEKGKAAGFNYYLTKPVNLAQLIQVFNQLIGEQNHSIEENIEV